MLIFYYFVIGGTDMNEYPKEHMFIRLCKEKGYKNVAEIGVFSGTLTNRFISSYVNAGIEIGKYYCVDPWKVYVDKYHRAYSENESDQDWWDSLYERVMTIHKKYPDNVFIVRMESTDAAKIMKNNSLEFDAVYIDGIHDEENIVKDVYSWLPLIRKGGMISGHDYIKTFADMAKALDNIFMKRLNIMIIDDSKPALSYKNTAQGGNWWVWVNNKMKKDCLKRIENIYPNYVESIK